MSWSLLRWTWRLDAPLFVGMSPSGSLNRCRLYVPARALWGALTSELAQATPGNKPPDYKVVGEQLGDTARFTYLYPAAQHKNSWLAWLPEYVTGKGLVWRPENKTSEETAHPDRQFRRWLLSTRPATAIDPNTDSTADASLRETECMQAHWHPNSPSGGGPVALVGYVFLKGDKGIIQGEAAEASLKKINWLFLGGDVRYGLGRVNQIQFEAASKVFGFEVDRNGDAPVVVSQHLLGHGTDTTNELPLWGAKEALMGWNRTEQSTLLQHINGPCWMPGSQAENAIRWTIGENEKAGLWTKAAEKCASEK